MIAFLLLGYWLTTKTPLGRYIYAIEATNPRPVWPASRLLRPKSLFMPSPASAPRSSG